MRQRGGGGGGGGGSSSNSDCPACACLVASSLLLNVCFRHGWGSDENGVREMGAAHGSAAAGGGKGLSAAERQW